MVEGQKKEPVVYTLTNGTKVHEDDVSMEDVFDELVTVLTSTGLHLGLVPELLRVVKSRVSHMPDPTPSS